MELRSGSNVYAVVDLEVQEFVTLKCMVLIANASRVTEPTGSEFDRDMGMATQFHVQAMVGTTETEGLGSEIRGALVEVLGRVEGRVEFPESPQFRHVGGNSHEFEPPPTICALEVILKALGVSGGDGGLRDIEVSNKPPCIGPPGELGSGCYCPLE